MRELEIYAHGAVHCSICTNIEDKKEIEHRVNAKKPTLLNHGWKISEDETFADGLPHPCPCEDKGGFTHYLMVC